MARLGALAALVGALVALHACRTARAAACVPSTQPQSWSIMVAAPAGADGQRVLNSVQVCTVHCLACKHIRLRLECGWKW